MVKKILCLCITAAVVIGLNLTLLFAQNKFSSLKCNITIEQQGVGKSEGKMYVKQEKSRVELITSGTSTVNLIDGQNAYMFIPAQKIAFVMDLTQAKAQVPRVEDYKKDCVYIKDEMVDGRACGVYECSQGGQAANIWIAKDIDFPVKIIISGSTTYYTDIMMNVALDDSLFILPQDAQIQDINKLMQGSQGLLN